MSFHLIACKATYQTWSYTIITSGICPPVGAKQLSGEGAFACPFSLSPQSLHNWALPGGAFQAQQGQSRGGRKDKGADTWWGSMIWPKGKYMPASSPQIPHLPSCYSLIFSCKAKSTLVLFLIIKDMRKAACSQMRENKTMLCLLVSTQTVNTCSLTTY